MLGIDPRTARITWTAALTLILLWAIYAIRGTLFVFAVAVLLAYLLYPLVDWISRRFSRRQHRGLALAVAWLSVIGLLAAVGIAVGSGVADQARQLFAHPPDIRAFFAGLKHDHPALLPEISVVESSLRQQLGSVASAVPEVGLSILAASGNLIFVIVIPILSFFILKDGPEMRDAFLAMFPAGVGRQRAQRTIADIHDLLLKYMRALLLLCSNVLIVYGIVLSSLGVQYPLLLAAGAFFCEFVPVIGPLTAMCAIIAVTALTGYSHVWWIVIFLAVFRLLQDYVISPRIMGEGVELHPLWVIFGIFAGDQIGGIPGVFLSVPALALARLLLDQSPGRAKT